MKVFQILFLAAALVIVGHFAFKDKVDPYLPTPVKTFLDKAKDFIEEKTSSMTKTDVHLSEKGSEEMHLNLADTLKTIKSVKAGSQDQKDQLGQMSN